MSSEVITSRLSVSKWIVMLTAGIPTTLCLTAVAPILPKMEAALAHGPTDQLLVKMVVAIIGVSMMLGAPVAGWLADKIGRAPLMFWAMVLVAPIGCSGYLIDNLWLMVGTRALLGIAAAATLTVGFTMIGDMPDPITRNRIIGIQVSISIFSALVALPLAGFLGDIYWRLPFMIFLFSLLLAAVVWTVRNEWAIPLPQEDARSAAIGRKPFPIPLGLMLLGFIVGTMSTVPPTYMPFQLRNLGTTSSTAIASVLMVPVIVSGLMAGFFGHASKRMSSRIAFAVSFALAGIGIAITAMATGYVEILGGSLIMAVGISWLTPNLMSHAVDVATVATRGRMVGIVNGAFYSATFAAVLVLEPIVRAAGPKGALLSMTALSLITALFFVAGVPTRRAT